MYELYITLIFQPIFNLLIFIYNIVPHHDMGITIILLTILIKAALYPLNHKQLIAQRIMQEMQPKLNELKEKYKDNKQALMQEQMKLFKDHKINPLSSCLPLLIQLPILAAVYQVFFAGLNNESLKLIYPFITNPGHINNTFLGFFSLNDHSIPLAVIAAVLQFFQEKMMITKRPPHVPGSKDEDMAAMMSQQMLFIMPLITLVIGTQLPAGLVLYWTVYNLLTIGQQYIVKKTPISSSKDSQEILPPKEIGAPTL